MDELLGSLAFLSIIGLATWLWYIIERRNLRRLRKMTITSYDLLQEARDNQLKKGF